MNDQSPPPGILIVDDTPVNLQLLAGMLKERGYRPRPVPSGKLAVQAALAEPPDLVLLDINMPEMNGYQVCERFKANDRLRDIPIIFLSALNETVNKVRGLQLGAVDYIAKPFQIEEVEARVQAHLKIRSLQRALQDQNVLLERKVAERTRELARANERLLAVDRLKDDFLLMIAHEMRTPSNGLFGICDLVFEGADFPDRAQYQALFDVSRGRLLQLLEDVELLTSADSLSQTAESDDVPLSALFSEVRESLESRQLSIESADDALGLPVKGNMAWVLRALTTFVRMATCFSANPLGVGLRVFRAGRFVRLEAPLDQLRLNDSQCTEFFELSSPVRTKSRAEPLGISPVVAHRIVSQLGGALLLTGNGSGGGLLVVELPLADA